MLIAGWGLSTQTENQQKNQVLKNPRYARDHVTGLVRGYVLQLLVQIVPVPPRRNADKPNSLKSVGSGAESETVIEGDVTRGFNPVSTGAIISASTLVLS